MSVDPNQEQVAVHTPPYVEALPAPAAEYPPAPVGPPAYQPAPPTLATSSREGRRRAWIVPAAVAAVGLIASGSLGYLFYSTNSRLEATQHQLTETQLTLDATKKSLDGEKAQAAYVQLVDADMGRDATDFALVTECDSYSACRSAAQTMLGDTQAFQSDLESAKTPTAFANAQAMLQDSLSAEITALKGLISALDTHDMNKIQNAFSAENDASLSVFKSESALARMIA